MESDGLDDTAGGVSSLTARSPHSSLFSRHSDTTLWSAVVPGRRHSSALRDPRPRQPDHPLRYVLPRHKAANWVGTGRGRQSTRPRANGVVELSPIEFLDRLADLVPSPRKHRHRYHGGVCAESPAAESRHCA
jgi:hypothetical protein